MKKKNWYDRYKYFILINNKSLEIYDRESGEMSTETIEGTITEKIEQINHRLGQLKEKRKLIITGEPFIFYKEQRSGDIPNRYLFDRNYKNYVIKEIKSLKENYISKKYYSKSFFKIEKSDFIDFFEIMSNGLKNRKNYSKVYVMKREYNKYTVFNEKEFTKTDFYGLERVEKVKESLEDIDCAVEKITKKAISYFEYIIGEIKNNNEIKKLKNSGEIKKVILKNRIERAMMTALISLIFIVIAAVIDKETTGKWAGESIWNTVIKHDKNQGQKNKKLEMEIRRFENIKEVFEKEKIDFQIKDMKYKNENLKITIYSSSPIDKLIEAAEKKRESKVYIHQEDNGYIIEFETGAEK